VLEVKKNPVLFHVGTMLRPLLAVYACLSLSKSVEAAASITAIDGRWRRPQPLRVRNNGLFQRGGEREREREREHANEQTQVCLPAA
jgi:hypothetical protein